MRSLASVLFAVALAVAASCGSGGSDNTVTQPNNGGNGSTTSSISVADNYFSPTATTVSSGTTVTWTWSGARQHNVTFDDGPASGTQTSGTYSRTFSATGTFAYHCTIHGQAMSGSVTVK